MLSAEQREHSSISVHIYHTCWNISVLCKRDVKAVTYRATLIIIVRLFLTRHNTTYYKGVQFAVSGRNATDF